MLGLEQGVIIKQITETLSQQQKGETLKRERIPTPTHKTLIHCLQAKAVKCMFFMQPN